MEEGFKSAFKIGSKVSKIAKTSSKFAKKSKKIGGKAFKFVKKLKYINEINRSRKSILHQLLVLYHEFLLSF
jgi:hypothetical protein